MTFDEINALTVSGNEYHLAKRILGEVEWTHPETGELDEESNPILDYLWASAIAPDGVTKPDSAALDAELILWQAELTAQEQARLDELARVQDINDRWELMPDIRGAFIQMSLDITNPALELKRIIEEDDQVRLSDLEAVYAVFDADQAVDSAREQEKAIGRAARKVCEDVKDLIAGININRTLTRPQIQQMKVTFKDIKDLLDDAQPWSAKDEIDLLSPDGTLITQGIKDKILLEFSKSGLPGL